MKKWMVIVIGLLAGPGWAIAPQKITYQGTLKQSGAAAQGTYSMTFRLTDSQGLTQYWSSSPMTVAVSQGLFSVVLSPTGVDWANITPYIEVNVNGQVLLPREAVNSTAYALECGSIAGMIAMFAGSCPAGWTHFAGLDSRFPMGGASYGAIGGSATHNHGGRTGPPNAQEISDAGNNFGSPVSNHWHSIAADSNIPPYLTMVFCQKQ
jgi:hypothetical protein